MTTLTFQLPILFMKKKKNAIERIKILFFFNLTFDKFKSERFELRSLR